MEEYEKKFCVGVINDIEVDEEIIGDVFVSIMDKLYNCEERTNFIKNNKNHNDMELIAYLISSIGCDVEDFCNVVGIDYDDLESIKSTEDDWSGTDFDSELNDRVDELSEENNDEDDDW